MCRRAGTSTALTDGSGCSIVLTIGSLRTWYRGSTPSPCDPHSRNPCSHLKSTKKPGKNKKQNIFVHWARLPLHRIGDAAWYPELHDDSPSPPLSVEASEKTAARSAEPRCCRPVNRLFSITARFSSNSRRKARISSWKINEKRRKNEKKDDASFHRDVTASNSGHFHKYSLLNSESTFHCPLSFPVHFFSFHPVF